ncbi:MAG: carboxypeptidase regulatory-like domain-containing protein [Bryobacteraceae bacterium]
MLGLRGIGIALLSLVAAIVCAQPNASRFALRGRAVDENGRPISGLQIALWDDKWKAVTEPVTSDADGRFVFNGLDERQYVMGASFHGETIFYRELPNSGDAVTTPAGPKYEGSEILFRVVPHAAIAGTVRDEFGDPVANASISLFQLGWRDGQAVFAPAEYAETDDRGQYRIHELHPGAYALCVAVEPNPNGASPFGAVAPQPGLADFQTHGEPRYYKRSCYPAKPPASFQIGPAQQVQKDFTLGSAHAFSVRGRVTNPPPETSFSVTLFRDDEVNVVEQPRSTCIKLADGSFEFEGVEPGRYRIEANAGAIRAGTAIHVEGADVGELELMLEPAGSIDVYVHDLPNGAAADVVRIGLRSTGPRPSETTWAQTGPDGALRFESVEAGTYWLQTRTNGPVCVESIRFGDREVLQGALTIATGQQARMDVATSTQCATIESKVVSQGKPAALARVLLLLSGSAESPGDTFLTTSSDDGTFSIEGLAPGRYLLWAWSQEEPGFAGPPNLAGVLSRAAVVVVTKGEHVAAVVPLLQPGGAPQ